MNKPVGGAHGRWGPPENRFFFKGFLTYKRPPFGISSWLLIFILLFSLSLSLSPSPLFSFSFPSFLFVPLPLLFGFYLFSFFSFSPSPFLLFSFSCVRSFPFVSPAAFGAVAILLAPTPARLVNAPLLPSERLQFRFSTEKSKPVPTFFLFHFILIELLLARPSRHTPQMKY